MDRSVSTEKIGPEDFHCSLYCSPIGTIGLVSFRGKLSDLLLGKSEDRVRIAIQERIGFLPIRDEGRFEKCHDSLDRYFSGAKITFNEPILFRTGTDLQKKVWGVLATIPYGTVWSYQDVADRLNMPNGARVIGGACGSNPIPIIIPCHRVIRHDGSIGGYSGGIALKRKLLAQEGVFYSKRRNEKCRRMK